MTLARLSLLCSILAFAIVPSVAMAGETTHLPVYSNPCIGITVPISEDWHKVPDSEIQGSMRQGGELMGLDAATIDATAKMMPGKALFMMSRAAPGGTGKAETPNMSLMALNVKDHRDEIRSGHDYLQVIADGLKKARPDATLGAIEAQSIAGQQFERLSFQLPAGDQKIGSPPIRVGTH